ncbi:regulator of G protein signaling domain-containing protein [Leptodontidium sp. 2 PMI_412]|nr:regulator of G protein signaling domain-containing protein [Leptodontidium sp. 2 PMI_412]
MHQTSSSLMRMTSDDRPFSRYLFAILVISLPLAPHRVRLAVVDYSFLSEEAINNLRSLKFSQSNRMPDPKLIESADGKQANGFTTKGSVWQLTPKGIHILERFCTKNNIQQKHVTELVNSPRNAMQLIVLERDSATDMLSSDCSTIEVIFRRFISQSSSKIKNSTTTSGGIPGVKMASERNIGLPPRTVHQTFTGKAATDWLMDYCTTVERRETVDIATLFLEQELIWCVRPDRAYVAQFSSQDTENFVIFQPTKHAIYQMTRKGKDVNMTLRERTSESGKNSRATARAEVPRDSNTQKLDEILNDAALRLLFRKYLRDTHCEENLSFYLDVDEFLKSCNLVLKANSPASGERSSEPDLDAVKETVASAYGIYNVFLAPGSLCELNLDHLFQNRLAVRMTEVRGQDSVMVESLKDVTKLFEEAQLLAFELMASDSVLKFVKTSNFKEILENRVRI